MTLRLRHHTPPSTDHLRPVSLFAGCSDRELAAIAGLTTQVDVAPGEVLCRQGQAGREAFIILDGEARVDAEGVELARLGGGAVCGELALLDGGARTATVTAVTPMHALVMSKADFSELMRHPAVSRRLLVALAGRLRLADRRLAD